MKKYFSKIIHFSLILPLALATVMCCQFSWTKPAAASVNIEKSMPACHLHKNKPSTPSKNNCSCCATKQLQAEQASKISLDGLKTVNHFVFLSVLPAQSSALKTKFNLAYLHGPPGLYADISLYIQNHNLRL